MILTRIRLRVPPERRREIVRTIRGVLAPTRVEQGCTEVRCGWDMEDENCLVVEEEWATQEDMERHIRSDRYRVMLSVLESATEIPNVQFFEVGEKAGMELVFKVRGSLCP